MVGRDKRWGKLENKNSVQLLSFVQRKNALKWVATAGR